ncbi:primosomal protein N' [Methylosoma difficile]
MAKKPFQQTLAYRIAIPVPLYRLFDYLPPESNPNPNLKPGTRLEVPFGKNNKIGYLIAVVGDSDIDPNKLKRVCRIIDEHPLLSAQDLKLLHWVARYYHHPIGEVFSTAFPVGLRQGKAATLQGEKCYALTALGKTTASETLKRSPKQKSVLEKFQEHSQPLSESTLNAWNSHWRTAVKSLIDKQLLTLDSSNTLPHGLGADDLPCNPKQQAAINAVSTQLGQFAVFLLEGVTGSGKTEVYMQIIRTVLAQGLQVLVLVPEITLTPQLEERFRQRFAAAITVSHSKLTDNQRQTAWLQMQQGRSAIMLGTRSALFTPCPNLGLIILDEEHDSSFKQQEGLRFSARDVAIVRAKQHGIPVLLGSATPSLESLYNAQRGRYQWLQLPERAGNALAPVLQLLDIRNKPLQEGLSDALLADIEQTLAKNEQVLLFLNRRGFAPTLICHSCGWVAHCQRCDANLVIHAFEQLLRCHHCGKEQRLLHHCPACQGGTLTALGLGTERVENVLNALFPQQTIVRLDRDSTQRKGALQNYLEQINQGHADIILGTQMLAKGHHFANVTLVAILDVDSGLFSIDFRAPEKLAQLIVQVSGRAGRAEKPGRVILQTRHPEHPLLTTLIQDGYQRFATLALAERKQAGLPPYSYQALFRAAAVDARLPPVFLETVSQLARQHLKSTLQILGPVPAPMSKRAGLYHYQLLLQSHKRQDLQATLDALLPAIEQHKPSQKVRWSLDVDPIDLY